MVQNPHPRLPESISTSTINYNHPSRPNNSVEMALKAPLHILLTGGARGIGRGLTRHFLTTGHRVFILDSNKKELFHTAEQASKWGGETAEHNLG